MFQKCVSTILCLATNFFLHNILISLTTIAKENTNLNNVILCMEFSSTKLSIRLKHNYILKKYFCE